MRAVAYCVTTHSKRLGDQMPTRSPLRTPGRAAPRAARSTCIPELPVRGAVALVAHDERLAVAEALDGAAQVLADGVVERGTSRGPAESESGRVVASGSMSMSGQDAARPRHFPRSQRTLGKAPAKPRPPRQPCSHVTEIPQGRRHRRHRRRARRGRRLRRQRRHVIVLARPRRRRPAPAGGLRPRGARPLRPGHQARSVDRQAPAGDAGGASVVAEHRRRAARSGRRAGQGARPLRGQGAGRDAGDDARGRPAGPAPANPASRASRTSSSSRRRASRRRGARPRADARAGAARPRLRGAHAATVGLADQQAAAYADPPPGRSGLRYARLTVPVGRGDLAAARPSPGVAGRPWRAAGMAPHVAFEHLATDRCPAAAVQRLRRAGPIRRRRPALRRGASRRCGPTRPGTRPITASQPVAEQPGGRRRLLRRAARRVREAAPWSRATSSTRGPTGRWLGALPARERDGAAAVGPARLRRRHLRP